MAFLPIRTAAEQVADYLRLQLQQRRWSEGMPGGARLATELGVGHNTVDAALRLLEKEGILAGRGRRSRRMIQKMESSGPGRALRVAMLLHSPVDTKMGYVVELAHELAEAGHTAVMGQQTLINLGMNVGRVSRFVRRTAADAWIVQAGSRDVLEWIAGQSVPSFAMFGQYGGLPMAGGGPAGVPGFREATRALIELGHRRIVCLCRRQWRLPEPASYMRAFLTELQNAGIPAGDFNLPDWQETNAGFQECLKHLFRVTPPTALIVDEAPYFVAALQFLAGRRFRVPEDVSLMCFDDDIAFAACDPPIACLRWNTRPLVSRILRWASNLSRGNADVRQMSIPVEFVRGGTIGPAPGVLPVSR